MDLNETLAAQKSKHHVSIQGLWLSHMGLLFPGVYLKPLGPKEQGQLSRLKKSLKAGGFEAAEVIDYVMNNWVKFANSARHTAGLESCPATPNIGFLLKYYEVALQLIAKSKVAYVEPVYTPVETHIVEEDEVYIPSPEEMAADLASLKKK